MSEASTQATTKALEFFKDWSNYLLVTTVAALGWVADSAHFSAGGFRLSSRVISYRL